MDASFHWFSWQKESFGPVSDGIGFSPGRIRDPPDSASRAARVGAARRLKPLVRERGFAMTMVPTRKSGKKGFIAGLIVAAAGNLWCLAAAAHEDLDSTLEASTVGEGLPGLVSLVIDIQRRANADIASYMNAIESGTDLGAFLFGLAIAFAYGAIHAFGPGHGKFLIVSYFLGQEARVMRGVAMAIQIAVVHVIAAVIVVWVADTVLRVGFDIRPLRRARSARGELPPNCRDRLVHAVSGNKNIE